MSDLDTLFADVMAPVPRGMIGRARPYDDAGAPYVLTRHRVPVGAVVRSVEEFVRLAPKASADERAEVESMLFDAPCVHVIYRA